MSGSAAVCIGRRHTGRRGEELRTTLSKQPSPSTTMVRVAFLLVAGLIAVLVVALPFAIWSLIDDLSSSVEWTIYPFVGTSEPGRARNSLHLSITDLDESRLTATLRVSGHRVCPSPCAWWRSRSPFGA